MIVLLAALSLLQAGNPADLVEKLRSDKIDEREAAARELRTLGEAALPALEKASRDPDANLARTSLEIAKDIRDRGAEKVLRKIEAAFDRAKTLKLAIRMEIGEGGEPDKKVEATIDCWIKGEKVSLEAKVPAREKDSRLVCDGDRMAIVANGEVRSIEQGWPNAGDRLKVGLLRVGLIKIERILNRRSGDAEEEADLRKVLQVSDFKLGPDEGTSKSILFRTSPPGGRESALVTLVYDPATFRVLRRSMQFSAGGKEQGSTTETFTEFAPDVEIPDDRFTLPERKK